MQVEDWDDFGLYFDGMILCNAGEDTEAALGIYDAVRAKDLNLEERVAKLREVEKPFLPEVEGVIHTSALSADSSLEGCSPEATQLIRMRCESAAFFLDAMHVGGSSIFALPQQPLGECIKWMLIDWWNTRGIWVYANMLSTETDN